MRISIYFGVSLRGGSGVRIGGPGRARARDLPLSAPCWKLLLYLMSAESVIFSCSGKSTSGTGADQRKRAGVAQRVHTVHFHVEYGLVIAALGFHECEHPGAKPF